MRKGRRHVIHWITHCQCVPRSRVHGIPQCLCCYGANAGMAATPVCGAACDSCHSTLAVGQPPTHVSAAGLRNHLVAKHEGHPLHQPKVRTGGKLHQGDLRPPAPAPPLLRASAATSAANTTAAATSSECASTSSPLTRAQKQRPSGSE